MCVARDFGPCCGLARWNLSIWALAIRPMFPPASTLLWKRVSSRRSLGFVEIDGVPASFSPRVPAIGPRARSCALGYPYPLKALPDTRYPPTNDGQAAQVFACWPAPV